MLDIVHYSIQYIYIYIYIIVIIGWVVVKGALDEEQVSGGTTCLALLV